MWMSFEIGNAKQGADMMLRMSSARGWTGAIMHLHERWTDGTREVPLLFMKYQGEKSCSHIERASSGPIQGRENEVQCIKNVQY